MVMTAAVPQLAERHRMASSGWLRAAVLGANDGILSTSSLVLGISAAHGTHAAVLLAGVSGLAAGAMAMAAGEYVSVHSQTDIEDADLERERVELAADLPGEQAELAAIYVQRGLEPGLAAEVARQLMAKDALGAHSRDELGLTDELRARPLQAALSSAASFSGGALLPLIVSVLVPMGALMPAVGVSSLTFLAVLGAVAARVGGAPLRPAAVRVVFWGALAMGVTSLVGALFGTRV